MLPALAAMLFSWAMSCGAGGRGGREDGRHTEHQRSRSKGRPCVACHEKPKAQGALTQPPAPPPCPSSQQHPSAHLGTPCPSRPAQPWSTEVPWPPQPAAVRPHALRQTPAAGRPPRPAPAHLLGGEADLGDQLAGVHAGGVAAAAGAAPPRLAPKVGVRGDGGGALAGGRGGAGHSRVVLASRM